MHNIAYLALLGILASSVVTIKSCDEKFSVISPGHTACLPVTVQPGDGVSEEEQVAILEYHNRVRADVDTFNSQPSATNMQVMRWDDELAMLAQNWASNCLLNHDQFNDRTIPGKYFVGQNVATHSAAKDWVARALDPWHNEVNHFSYGYGSTTGQVIGHYTAMVWADTTRVGCGYALCGNMHFYVCDYAPIGNRETNDDPTTVFQPYENGATASACSRTDSSSKLCDCGEEADTCYNEGKMDVSACTCQCMAKPWYDPQRNCALDCSLAEDDDQLCATRGGGFNVDSCSLVNVPNEYCPVMCRWCPYADAGPSAGGGGSNGGGGDGGAGGGDEGNDEPEPTPTPYPIVVPDRPAGLNDCDEPEPAICGQPSVGSYHYTSADCVNSQTATECPAMCDACAAVACLDSFGDEYDIGEYWLTTYGRNTCTYQGTKHEDGCVRDDLFAPIGGILTYEEGRYSYTCNCIQYGTGGWLDCHPTKIVKH